MAFSIDSSLLPVKAHFFLYFGGTSPVILFMATFAKQLGLSSAIVGLIFTVLPILSMTGKLIMGAFGDKFQCHKPLLICYIVILTLSVSLLTVIVPLSSTVEAEIMCNQNSKIKICSKGSIKKCMESQIQSEFPDNKTLNCWMDCRINKEFFDSDCESWIGSDSCETLVNKSTIKQPITNEMIKHNYNINLFNMSLKSPTDNEIVVQSTFDAILQPFRVIQEGMCLLIDFDEVNVPEQGRLSKPTCKKPKNFTCEISCEDPILMNIGEPDEEGVMGQHQFWLFTFTVSLCWIGIGSISCLAESICFALLGDRPSEFGKQRLWGSLGWGVMSLFGGALIDFFSRNKAKKDYNPVFYISVTLIFLDLLAASRIKDIKRKKPVSLVMDIGKLFADMRVIVYILWCIFAGMANGLILGFLFWHIEELTDCEGMKNIKTLEGLYVMLQSFGGELPSFFVSAWILKKIGHVKSMSLTLIFFSTMFLLFSILETPVYFLPISILHGVAFSTMYATMTSYASIIAPPGTAATMLGLISSVYEGIGISLGSYVSGQLLRIFPGGMVFRMFGIAAITLCIVHIITQYFIERSSKYAAPISEKVPGDRVSVLYTSPQTAIDIMKEETSRDNAAMDALLDETIQQYHER